MAETVAPVDVIQRNLVIREPGNRQIDVDTMENLTVGRNEHPNISRGSGGSVGERKNKKTAQKVIKISLMVRE